MKLLRIILSTTALALQSSALLADNAPAAPTPPTPLSRPTKKIVYLGVGVERVDQTLSAQLRLPEGTGLRVLQVTPDSPASAHLKEHDILTKFRDQILVEPRQLGVLVSISKDGETVPVTFIRESKEQVAEIKLAQRTIAISSPDDEKRRLEAVADEVRRRREQRANSTGSTSIILLPSSASRSTSANDFNITTETDKSGSVSLKIEQGKRSVVIKDPEGKILFEGPADTDADHEKIPKEWQAKVTQMERDQKSRMLSERIERRRQEELGKGFTTRSPRLYTDQNSWLTQTDASGTIELKVEKGLRSITAKDPEGKIIFDGPLNTEAERSAVPESLRARVQDLERTQDSRLFRERFEQSKQRYEQLKQDASPLLEEIKIRQQTSSTSDTSI